jgi:spore coat polysaccharide biosynthesis predicted glycosyltransferase SpsG/predicted acetyltransferase
MNKLLVLTAGNPTIGFGHFVRCHALVTQLKEMESVFYSIDNLSANLEDDNSGNIRFKKLSQAEDILTEITKNDCVLVDDYQVSRALLHAIKSKCSSLICIDDLADAFMIADLVINPTPGFELSRYRGNLDTQYLIGIEYALLRKPFQDLAIQPKSSPNRNLMICFGGSDPKNLTAVALRVLETYDYFDQIHVVLGPGYVYQHELKTQFSTEHIQYHQNLSAEAMASLMSKNTYGIYPCSGILLEALAAKQQIASGFYVDNQKYVYAQHLKIGSFEDAKSFELNDLKTAIDRIISNENASKTNELIDGKSIERIQKHLDTLCKMSAFEIREAAEIDTEITFSWAKHPDTRKYSFSKDPILWDSHCAWFLNKINSKNCLYLILENRSKKIGSIRFDINEQNALISYLIAPEFHGKGYGTLLLKKGLQFLEINRSKCDFQKVTGVVQKSNIASIKTFERFGFQTAEENGNFVFTKNSYQDNENWNL